MLIGLDQGTTGTTCVVVDDELNPLATSYRRLATRYPRPGWVEQDPEAIVRTVAECVAEVLASVGRQEPIAVGIANQGETIVAWDRRTKEPLTPALVWSDRRANDEVELLRAAGRASDIQRLSGLPLETYFSAAKMRWLLENHQGVRRARVSGTLAIGTLDTWLATKFGDEPASTDHSTASRTQLFSPGAEDWDDELLAAFGIPRSILPSIRPSLGERGRLRHPSWGRSLEWHVSLVDQAAALAGNACLTYGATKVTYGTGCFALVNAGQAPPNAPDGLLAVTAWSEPEARTYAVEGGAFTAGTAIDWLKNLGIVTDAAESGRLAASVVDDDSVRFLPALTGLGAPWWQGATGVLAGLTGATTRAHVAKAVLDSIAFRVRDILDAAWAGGLTKPTSLRVDGGLTANEYLMQRQANVLGLPVAVASFSEATAIGAAALAGIARGLLTWSDLGERLSPAKLVTPNASARTSAAEYDSWRSWVERACELPYDRTHDPIRS